MRVTWIRIAIGVVALQYTTERLHHYLFHYFDKKESDEEKQSRKGYHAYFCNNPPYVWDYPLWGMFYKLNCFMRCDGHNLFGYLLARYIFFPFFRWYFGLHLYTNDEIAKVINETVRILKADYFKRGNEFFKKGKTFV